jgi:hypothetical protein
MDPETHNCNHKIPDRQMCSDYVPKLYFGDTRFESRYSCNNASKGSHQMPKDFYSKPLIGTYQIPE